MATSAAPVAASAASVAAAGVAATTTAMSDKLYVGPGCPDVFLVEDIERRQGNVGNFLLTKSDFLALCGAPGRHVGCLSCGYRRCAARLRQRQPGGSQQGYGACPMLPLRGFLCLGHGDLPYLLDRVRNDIVRFGMGIRQAFVAQSFVRFVDCKTQEPRRSAAHSEQHHQAAQASPLDDSDFGSSIT